MKTKITIIGLAALILSGCGTDSGVVPMGQNAYMISKTEWGFMGPVPIKGDAIREAQDYCKEHDKALMVTKTIEINIKFGSEPGAEVYFEALDTNDPALKQPVKIEDIVR
jgi:hypothetical protein